MLVGVAGRWLSPSLIFFLRISSNFSLGKKKGLAVFRFAEARRRGLWASGRPIDWIDLPSPSFCPSSFIGNRIVRLIFFSHFPSPCALPASPFLSFKQMMIDQSPSPHLLPATTDSIRLVPEMADFSSNFFFFSLFGYWPPAAVNWFQSRDAAARNARLCKF